MQLKILTPRQWPVLGFAIPLLACATPAAHQATTPGEASSASSRQCFRPADVNGWRAGDNQTVYVGVGLNRVFRMQLMGPCPDINWSEAIGIQARGSPWICSGLDATIIAPSSIGPRRCPVTDLRELSTEEIAALPRAIARDISCKRSGCAPLATRMNVTPGSISAS